MSRSQKVISHALLLVALCLASAAVTRADTITVTLPDFNGAFTAGGVFPRPSLTVGTFNFTLPPGFQIGSAFLSGTFGNSVNGTTAPVNISLDSLQITQCAPGAPCTGAFGTSGPTPFFFSFTGANFSLLTDGAAVFTISQLGAGAVRLGNLTLTVVSLPEPASMVLLGSGIAVLAAGWRRRKGR